jgi:hypothetical protein
VTSWFTRVASNADIVSVLGQPKFKESKKTEEKSQGFDMKAYKSLYSSLENPHDSLIQFWKQNANLQQGNSAHLVTSNKSDFESIQVAHDSIAQFSSQFPEESTLSILYVLKVSEDQFQLTGMFIGEGKETPKVFKTPEFSEQFSVKRLDWKKNKKDVDNYLSTGLGSKLNGKVVSDKKLNF